MQSEFPQPPPGNVRQSPSSHVLAALVETLVTVETVVLVENLAVVPAKLDDWLPEALVPFARVTEVLAELDDLLG